MQVHPGRLTWFTYKSPIFRKENDLIQTSRELLFSMLIFRGVNIPIILLMDEILHQLIGSLSHCITTGFYTCQVVQDFFHQQYGASGIHIMFCFFSGFPWISWGLDLIYVNCALLKIPLKVTWPSENPPWMKRYLFIKNWHFPVCHVTFREGNCFFVRFFFRVEEWKVQWTKPKGSFKEKHGLMGWQEIIRKLYPRHLMF